MFKGYGALVVAAALCSIGTSAQAQAYDFSTFSAEGQSYQGATLGVMTLSSSNGTLIYTNNYGGGLYDGFGAASDITLTFSSAVSSISLRAGDGAGDLDAFGLLIYEFGTNNLLGSFYSPQFGGPNEPELRNSNNLRPARDGPGCGPAPTTGHRTPRPLPTVSSPARSSAS